MFVPFETSSDSIQITGWRCMRVMHKLAQGGAASKAVYVQVELTFCQCPHDDQLCVIHKTDGLIYVCGVGKLTASCRIKVVCCWLVIYAGGQPVEREEMSGRYMAIMIVILSTEPVCCQEEEEEEGAIDSIRQPDLCLVLAPASLVVRCHED